MFPCRRRPFTPTPSREISLTPPAAPPRPVSHADPAWFETLPRRRPDGSPEPDYGRLFYAGTADGGLAYSFDRQGLRFCRRLPPPAPREGWLESQGRTFRIAGPAGGIPPC